eukprot:CAMPEP_0117538392 /NCGR_PEP_ID=MMETSP0784-20121206/42456_1 /TAXON_ID=39447 /ORGANISM="" /LENGTH=424 /DNA_ID=CAMNT_0005335007 /DNA_START=42 /DNA_END=1316 /DNA_ORIENTATION=+
MQSPIVGLDARREHCSKSLTAAGNVLATHPLHPWATAVLVGLPPRSRPGRVGHIYVPARDFAHGNLSAKFGAAAPLAFGLAASCAMAGRNPASWRSPRCRGTLDRTRRLATPKTILVNAGRLDFDGRLDFSKLASVVELTRHDADANPEQVLDLVQGQEVVITKEIPVPGYIISQFPDTVRLIQEAGTGFNNIDVDVAKARGITVCNCPSYSSDAVAQLVMTFVLNFSCSLVPQMLMLARGNLDNFGRYLQVPHFELGGKTIGLIGGSGGIGSKVAMLAETMGMRVIITSRNAMPNAVALDELLQTSDFVSLHCPLTEETRHIINQDALNLMKPTAFLINTGRGPLIKEDDLIKALESGTIAGAGLDVQDPEPPVAGSPLYKLENVILTPHIGWKRLESRQRLIGIIANNINAYIQGNPTNVVA